MSNSKNRKTKPGFVYLIHCELKNPELKEFTAIKYGCTSLPVQKRMVRLRYEKKSTHIIKGILCYAHVKQRYEAENKIKWGIQDHGLGGMDETIILDADSGETIQSVIQRFSDLVRTNYGSDTVVCSNK